MDQGTKRLFVALRPPPGVTTELSLIQGEFQEKIDFSRHADGGRIRWTRLEQLHLTLVFASAFPESQVDALKNSLVEICAAQPPFEIRLTAPESRPSRRDPKVIWSPAATETECLLNFRRALNRHIESLIDPGQQATRRKFLPHVTLGRIGRGGSRGFLQAIRVAVQGVTPPSSPWILREIELIESLLGPSGARHSILQTFPLGAP